MKKNRYDIDILIKALDILNSYEIHMNKPSSGGFPNAECYMVSDINIMMGHLKSYVENVDDSLSKLNAIEGFRVIVELAFNKLEKDVMGVN